MTLIVKGNRVIETVVFLSCSKGFGQLAYVKSAVVTVCREFGKRREHKIKSIPMEFVDSDIIRQV